MTAAEVGALFARLERAFTAASPRLGQLDAAVGDGDHGAGMARGFAAAAAAVDDADAHNDGPGQLFARAGRALMSAVGGASGPLFGTLLLEIGKALSAGENGGPPTGGDDAAGRLADGVAAAAERIQRLGRSNPGDKTLLEALLPAAAALAQRRDAELAVALAAAAAAAEAGAQASAELPARRGRARYVEGAGVGHPDPGAVSIALLFTTWSDHVAGGEGET